MERYEINASHVQGTSDLPAGAVRSEGISLAIGFFDGVHKGHCEVVRQAVAIAKERGLVPAVLTFDPHPRVVLGHGPQYDTVLTPLEDKLSFLADVGVEAAYVIRFDKAFSEVSAERFVRSLLTPLGVKAAIVGFDFKFGHRGEGNAEALSSFGDGEIDVIVVPPVFSDGVKAGSTRIRDLLAEGSCAEASRLLGRFYSIKGEVVHGDARGRTIGFPTANLRLEQPYVIPRLGVYAMEARILSDTGAIESSRIGVLNLGFRPTFDAPGGELKVEAHLFDFDGDLYGRTLEVCFRSYIRGEKKFGSLDELKTQIAADAAKARELLTEAKA